MKRQIARAEVSRPVLAAADAAVHGVEARSKLIIKRELQNIDAL